MSIRLHPVIAAVVLSLALGAGCSSGGPVDLEGAAEQDPAAQHDPAAQQEDYTTVTGSLFVGDRSYRPPMEEEFLPEVAPPTELPSTLDPFRGQRQVGVTDVVLGEYDGRRGLEYRFGGTGPVAYTVRYVDLAVRYASSEPVTTAGRSVLQVDLSGTTVDADGAFVPYPGPGWIRGDADSAVASVDFVSDPGGISQSFVGISGHRPEFTVTTTQEPAALIITVES